MNGVGAVLVLLSIVVSSIELFRRLVIYLGQEFEGWRALYFILIILCIIVNGVGFFTYIDLLSELKIQ